MKIFFLIGLIIFINIIPVCADEIMIVTEDLAPYNYVDDTGKVTGVATEIVKEVLKEARIEADISVYPWARAYKIALNKENVLIYSIRRTEEREELFKWVGVITASEAHIYKLKKRTDIKIDNLEDIDKYVIGVVNEDVVAQQLEKRGLSNVLASPKTISSLKKLFDEEIDLIAIDKKTIIHDLKVIGKDINLVEKVFNNEEASGVLYMAFSKSTPNSLVMKFQKALERINISGVYKAVQDKWSE